MSLTGKGDGYTSFRSVSVKDGRIRLEDPFKNTTYAATHVSNYGTRFEVASGTLTGNRVLHLVNGDGSMMVKGYDMLYGTATFVGSGNIAAQTVAQSSFTVSGALTTCVILISAATSAQVAGYVPIGGYCSAASKVIVFYKTQAATAAVATVPVNYTVLFPQTT